MLTREDALKVLDLVKIDVRGFLGRYVFERGASVFEGLVAVMLTQNTTDRAAFRVYEALKGRLGEITPRKILSLNIGELEELLRPIGAQRQRALRIVELSRVVEERFGGSLEFVRNMDVGEARKLLLSLPGVGPKTADVVLLNLGKPTFPVDTHIFRISRRLGIVGGYGEVSGFWMSILKPDEYLKMHLALIAFGRTICRARNPKCWLCPLRNSCNYYKAEGVKPA